jgi:tellurite methyltransferase
MVLASPPVKNIEHNTYEAITGESADEEKSFWDTFYKQKDHAFGREAVGFLKDHIQLIPKGKAFLPAMGEGRNAIFLAKNGFEVIGNDISDVAIDKAKALAKKLNLNIKASVVNMKEYSFKDNEFDFIFISLFYDRDLLQGLKKSLKKGGLIMFYEEIYNGDPTKAPSQFWVKSNELKSALKDMRVLVYKEYDDHGKKVVGVLAKK